MPKGRPVKTGSLAPRTEEAAVDMLSCKPHNLTHAASEHWDRIVPLIAAQCGLKELDADALAQYCEAFAMRGKALKEMEGHTLVVETTNGSLQRNPLLAIVAQQDALILKLSERFGLDPASRKRLEIASSRAGKSAFTEFLNKKN